MNVPAESVSAETSPARAAHACHIVVAYEDVVAHGRALELAGRLATQFGGEPSFTQSSWSFKDLAEPAHSRAAVQAVAVADIILFSVHGNQLPSAVRLWLDLCSGQRTKADGSLALLLAEPFMLSSSSVAVIGRLRHAARLLHMDFLPLIPQPAEQIIRRFQERTIGTPSGRSEIADQPSFDHWGLNE